MRYLLPSVLMLFHVICYSQSQQEYVFISELRLGTNGEFVAPYEQYNRAVFSLHNTADSSELNEIEVQLVQKEIYYNTKIIRGTEIRFHVPKKYLSDKNEVSISGKLQTVLSGELIDCFLRNPVTIKLLDGQKIGANIYKLDMDIRLEDPAKFTLTSIINFLNQILDGNIIYGPSYKKEVAEIMNFNPNNEIKQKAILKTCYEIYALIEPHFTENTYFPNEDKELKTHIAQINNDIKAIAVGNYNGSESLESLKRDLFESELVVAEYLKLKQRLLPLKNKIESILFSPIKTSSNTCEKNIDFNLVTAVSFSSEPLFFNKHFVNANDTIEAGQNGLSFSLVAMTNIYLVKKRMPINPSISVGLGANVQGSKIGLGGFFGGGLAFGKKRHWGINVGFSYLPIRELNPSFEIGLPIPAPFEEKDAIRTEYHWSPFVSATVPLNWILGLFSSSDNDGKLME